MIVREREQWMREGKVFVEVCRLEYPWRRDRSALTAVSTVSCKFSVRSQGPVIAGGTCQDVSHKTEQEAPPVSCIQLTPCAQYDASKCPLKQSCKGDQGDLLVLHSGVKPLGDHTCSSPTIPSFTPHA